MPRTSFIACSALLLLACAGPTQGSQGRGRAGDQTLPDGATQVAAGSVSGIRAEPREVRLATAPVEGYGRPATHTLSPGEEALLKKLGGRRLRHEPGLSRMARELARTAPDRYHMPASLIDALMAWSGLTEPPPRIAVVEVQGSPCGEDPAAEGCASAIDALAAEVGTILPEEGDGWVGVGIAPVDGMARFIIAVTERTVVLGPMPLEVAAGGKVKVSGRLLAGRSEPRIEVVDAGGSWSQVPLQGGKGGPFTATVPCTGEGAHQIEVLAQGPRGPEVAANFPVYCGVQAPRSARMTIEHVDAGVDLAAIERVNFDALNRARTVRGLRPLAWDNAAAEVARAHSRDMATHDFLGHRSETTGEAGDRFKRAGVATIRLRENVGRGYGPATIHEALMQSPGHRINMLATDVTRVGIGAVIGEPESDAPEAPRPIFLTQNFYEPPGVTPDDPVAALRGQIDELRRASELRGVTWDPALDRMAQGLADGIGRGDEAAARKRLDAQFQASAYKAVSTQTVSASDFSALRDVPLWKNAKLGDAVGLGIAHYQSGPREGSIVLVALVAER